MPHDRLPSNEELLVRFRRTADPDLFRKLVERTVSRVTALGRRYRLSSGDLDDLIQDTYLAVLLGIDQFDPEQSVAGWVYGIARRKARLVQRARRSKQLHSEPHSIDNDPGEALDAARLQQTVLDSLARLHPKYRRVVQLYYLERMSAKSIAAALGQQPSTVRTQIQRGVEELRRMLPYRLPVTALCVGELGALPRPTAPAATPPTWHRPAMWTAITATTCGIVALALAGTDDDANLPSSHVLHETLSAGEAMRVDTEHREGLAPPPPSALIPAERRTSWIDRANSKPIANLVLGCQQIATELPTSFRPGFDSYRLLKSNEDGELVLPIDLPSPARFRFSDYSGGALVPTFSAEKATFAVGRVAYVAGQVLDESRQPAPGAEVWIAENSVAPLCPPALAIRADTSGSFRFAVAESAAKRIWARLPGASRSNTETVTFDGKDGKIDLLLQPARGGVHGRVFHTERQPAAGALVALYAGGLLMQQPPVLAWTDADGRYRIETLLPGKYDLVVIGTGGEPAWQQVSVDQSSAAIDVSFAKGASIRGVVRDTSGAALAGVFVLATPTPRHVAPNPHLLKRFAMTNSDGTFAIDNLLPGPIAISVIDENSAPMIAATRTSLESGATWHWEATACEHYSVPRTIQHALRWWIDSQDPERGSEPPPFIRLEASEELLAKYKRISIQVRLEGPGAGWKRSRHATVERPCVSIVPPTPGTYVAIASVAGQEIARRTLAAKSGENVHHRFTADVESIPEVLPGLRDR